MTKAGCSMSTPGFCILTSLLAIQFAIHGVSGADQSQMGKRLRKISKVFSRWSQFFTIQSKVVRISQHLFEEEPGSLDVARPCQALDKPERANAERSFISR